MKFFYKYFFFYLLSFTFFLSAKQEKLSSEIVHTYMRKAIKPIEKKYNMSLCGIGGSYNNGFKQLCMHLERRGDNLTKNDARLLIINCVEEFIENINKESELKLHLKDFPISSRNIALFIYNFDRNYNKVYFPIIGGVGLSCNSIEYSTRDPHNIYRNYSSESETYEDALKILHQGTPQLSNY